MKALAALLFVPYVALAQANDSLAGKDLDEDNTPIDEEQLKQDEKVAAKVQEEFKELQGISNDLRAKGCADGAQQPNAECGELKTSYDSKEAAFKTKWGPVFKDTNVNDWIQGVQSRKARLTRQKARQLKSNSLERLKKCREESRNNPNLSDEAAEEVFRRCMDLGKPHSAAPTERSSDDTRSFGL